VCAAAVETASHVRARAIACLTHSGRTARLISRYRPEQEIVVALTDSAEVIRQAGLLWGTIGVSVDRIDQTDSIFPLVRSKLRAMGMRGRIVLTAGIPVPEKGSTNTLHIVSI